MAQPQAFLDFLSNFKAFCKNSGRQLPSSCHDSWISWWGPLKVDLRALYAVLQQHACLDHKTPGQVWRAVGCSIGGAAVASLPPERIQHLFLKHFAEYKDYEARCNKENKAHSVDQQMQLKQGLPGGQEKRQKFISLNDHLPCKEPALGGQPAATKHAAPVPSKASAPGFQSLQSSRAPHKPGSGSESTAAVAGLNPAAGVRRSGRTRTQAVRQGYVSSNFIHTDSSSDSDGDPGSDSESEADPIPIGPAHQACLPKLQCRPASGPTAAEAKFLTQPVYTPGSLPQQPEHSNPGLMLAPGEFNALWEGAGSGPARLQLLESWVTRMDKHMGQDTAQSLGLSLLGYKLKASWAPHEELLFGLSMLERYRMFRHMKRCYLPKRSVHELNSYYHNVWKPRAGKVAEEFAQLCEQHGDPLEFRVQLCKRLVAIWVPATMGPVPNSAALPPVMPETIVPAAASHQARVATAISTPSHSTLASSVPSTSTAAQPAVASSRRAAVQRAEPLVADATVKVATTAGTALKQRQLAVAALQPVHKTSMGSMRALSPATLPMAGRRIALGLQQALPVTAAAPEGSIVQLRSSLLCVSSAGDAPSTGKPGPVPLSVAEGPHALSSLPAGQRQQQQQCLRQSSLQSREQQHVDECVVPYPAGPGQHPQKLQQQQQPAHLPFPARPTLQQRLPQQPEARVQQQKLAVQLTVAKPAGSSMQQQSQPVTPPPPMSCSAAGPVMNGGKSAGSRQHSCMHPGGSINSSEHAAERAGDGCLQTECQAQRVNAEESAGAPQPGCQDQTETEWPCISLLSQSDADSPDSASRRKHPGYKRKVVGGSGYEAAAAHGGSHKRNRSDATYEGDVIYMLD